MKRFKHLLSGGLALLLLLTWSSNAYSALLYKYNTETGRVELTIGGPLVGGTQTIQLISGESVLSDMEAFAGQFSATVDEAVSSITGCIKDPDGKPIIGALVIGLKPDSPQPATFAITAGESGGGFYGLPPFNWPVPAPPQPAGCYTMIIPPGLYDFAFTAMVEGMQLMFGSGAQEETGSVTAISVTAFIPGYSLDPGIRHIAISPNGVMSVSSVDAVSETGEINVERTRAR